VLGPAVPESPDRVNKLPEPDEADGICPPNARPAPAWGETVQKGVVMTIVSLIVWLAWWVGNSFIGKDKGRLGLGIGIGWLGLIGTIILLVVPRKQIAWTSWPFQRPQRCYGRAIQIWERAVWLGAGRPSTPGQPPQELAAGGLASCPRRAPDRCCDTYVQPPAGPASVSCDASPARAPRMR
jgi:hypothetical protein